MMMWNMFQEYSVASDLQLENYDHHWYSLRHHIIGFIQKPFGRRSFLIQGRPVIQDIAPYEDLLWLGAKLLDVQAVGDG
jgi:hypothetical protein